MTDVNLLDRMKELKGPSREMDGEIDAILFGGRAAHTFTEDNGGARLRKSYDPGTVFLNLDPNHNGGHVLCSHHRKAPAYTASIDAAIALVEKMLPPAWVRLDEWFMGEDKPAVAAILPKPTPNVTFSAKAATLPIALLIALLTALESGKTEGGGE